RPEGADVEVAVLQFRDVAAPPEQGLHVPPFARFGDGAVEPGPHTGEPIEILGDEVLRLLLRDAELAGERERALAVDRGEVDRLGTGAPVGRRLLLGDAEDDRRRLTVDFPPRP